MFVSMPTKMSHVDGSQFAGLRKIRRESVGALTWRAFSIEVKKFNTARFFVIVQRFNSRGST